uniref:Putative mediator of RNA polymerase II transcription subunit 26c n=1 Tax=Davidia involucrata TaxID=16924 RepID=A0A5B6YMW0_DAVIN
MDLDDFRMILSNYRVDVWTFIDTAITVASLDYGHELKNRRDLIVERLYASVATRCQNCEVDPNGHETKDSMEKESSHEGKGDGSPSTPQSIHSDDDDNEELDPYAGLFDDEEAKILRIKEQLEDPDQSEDSVVELLQSLADMDITFKALKETDIGRHVNRLRKHSSNDVRRLVKQLVRKWKDLVDDWVKLNTPGQLSSSTLIVDGDSPQPKNPHNGHHQVPDFAYSPNPHNGSSGSDKNNSEPEPKPKTIPRREAPTRPSQSVLLSASASAPPPNRPHKDTSIDLERLASARKRLQENYQEAQNAKKQRTIQMMDIHEIPKPKNTFFSKNKGGFQGRNHR